VAQDPGATTLRSNKTTIESTSWVIILLTNQQKGVDHRMVCWVDRLVVQMGGGGGQTVR
jgi:hypothetical protein